MLSWIVLICLLGVLVVLGIWLWGGVFGRGEVMEPAPDSTRIMEHNRAAIARGDIDAVRLEVVSRGYRQDQVDDLIAALTDAPSPAAAKAPSPETSEPTSEATFKEPAHFLAGSHAQAPADGRAESPTEAVSGAGLGTGPGANSGAKPAVD